MSLTLTNPLNRSAGNFTELNSLPGNNGEVLAIATNSDVVASCCSIGQIFLWKHMECGSNPSLSSNISSQLKFLGSLQDEETPSAILDAIFLSSHHLVVGRGSNDVAVWDISTGKLVRIFRPKSSNEISVINAVCTFRLNSNLIGCGGDNGFITLFDIREKERNSTHSTCHMKFNSPITCLDTTENDDLFVGTVGGSIHGIESRTWSSHTNILGAHRDVIYSIQFRPCRSSILLSTGMDGAAKIWDMRYFGMDEKDRLISEITGLHVDKQYNLQRAAWDKSGSIVGWGSDEGNVTFFNVDSADRISYRYSRKLGQHSINDIYFLSSQHVVLGSSQPSFSIAEIQ